MPDRISNKIYDVVVVGGGMAAAHAAWPLVYAGKDVLMLDGGVVPSSQASETSGKDFEEMRRSDAAQHRLFLGENPVSLISGSRTSHSSAMTSGNRAYVSEHTREHLPLDQHGVHIIQSLAKGGLSEAWGAVCALWSEQELAHAGIPEADMHAHYQAVIDRVGVSGHAPGYRTQPQPQITASMRQLRERYQALAPGKRRGFEVHDPLLALLTEALGWREPTSYSDLDFYRAPESAIYRARYTIEDLERSENFHYQGGQIVQQVRAKSNHQDSYQEVVSKNFQGVPTIFHGRRIVLAAGAINSTRIMLESDATLPASEFMMKPNYTIACIDPRLLGASGAAKRYSLCQLTLDLPDAVGESMLFANLYNYRSLMLWRLLQYAPLPAPEALSLLSIFAPSLILVDVRFPGSEGRCEATLGEQGLIIRRKEAGTMHEKLLPELRKFLRNLGLVPVRSAELPLGASVHYAGGIRTHQNGEVETRPGIFAADASSWRALPAKPSGLTIMANANRIGTEVLHSL